MAITQADLEPYINQGTLGTQSQGSPSYAPSYGQVSTTGGPTPHTTNDWLSIGDPLGGGFLSDLFGFGDKAGFKGYQDANGNWVFAPPGKRNPIPLARVPGASLKPGGTALKQTDSVQNLYNILPYLNEAINNTAVPTARAGYDATAATAGPYAQLMVDIFNQFGPKLNAIGNEINKRNSMAQAESDRDVLRGPGGESVKAAYDLSQIYDKPYYDTRATTASRISDLLNSIDLSGGLSDVERREVGAGLAQEGVRRGTGASPSALNTVSNAMRFGAAGNQRQQQAKSNLAAAIQGATGFLPASKSGVDVFQVATGRPSMPNQGASNFTGLGPQSNNQGSLGLAGNLLQGSNALQLNTDTINSQKKDWADYLGQVTSSIGNLTSAAGGIAGMCYVARKVYGVDNPKWLLFRKWLINKAPENFRNFYIKYGEQISKSINESQILHIRNLMDKILLNEN